MELELNFIFPIWNENQVKFETLSIVAFEISSMYLASVHSSEYHKAKFGNIKTYSASFYLKYEDRSFGVSFFSNDKAYTSSCIKFKQTQKAKKQSNSNVPS